MPHPNSEGHTAGLFVCRQMRNASKTMATTYCILAAACHGAKQLCDCYFHDKGLYMNSLCHLMALPMHVLPYGTTVK